MNHVEPRNIAPERSKWRRLAQARGNTCSCSAHDVMFSTFPKESGLDLKIIGNQRKFNWSSLNPSTLLKIFYSILLQFKNARFISILNLVCQRSNWSRAWISQCAKTTKDNGAGRICPSPGCAKSSGKRSCSRTWWVKQELIDGLQVIASSWSMSEKVGLAPKANTCSLWTLSIPHSSYLEYFGIHAYPCQHTASVLAKWVKHGETAHLSPTGRRCFTSPETSTREFSYLDAVASGLLRPKLPSRSVSSSGSCTSMARLPCGAT